MRFVDIDEQERGPSAESARAIGVEAQEAANQLRYERALRLQGSGKVEAAAECFRELLAQRLVADAVPAERPKGCPSGADPPLERQPSLLLRYLSLKNLAQIEAGMGQHAQALERLLAAVQLQRGDALVWYRLGTLAAGLGQRHLARHAFEQVLA